MTPLRFDPRQSGARCWLHPFEDAVMATVWKADTPLTVKRVWRTLWDTHERAYTSVATTMMRLVAKGLLTRRRSGMAFVFAPTLTEQEFIDIQRGYVRAALEG